MITRILSLLLIAILISPVDNSKWIGVNEDGLCEGNRFLFLSTYVLGRQKDLTLTFEDINKTAKVEEVSYSDQPFRTYRIFNMKQNITYLEGKQNPQLMGNNVLRIANGSLRIDFTFEWEKTQLGSSLFGNGTGTVGSDSITYEKTLQTNGSHELQWYLSYVEPITITNGLSLKTMQPYKDKDYQTLSNMLNFLKTGQRTVKDNLLKILNANYTAILAEKVLQDPTLKFEKTIQYEYTDYHGKFQTTFNQTLMNSTLAQDGLYLLFSQVIHNDEQFECGEPVPQTPDDPVFGGLQQFISNSLLKSTLKYALKQGWLDVVLNQEWWQSRAFQFFMGDLHEVMPSSTKKLSTMIEITGKCNALNDPVFSFLTKSSTMYEVKVNFGCLLNYTNTTRLAGINTVVTYQIKPTLGKFLDFMVASISGTPTFVESQPFKIEYKQLAEFMVTQTMNLAINNLVVGSGYKAVPRKFPGIWVKQNYLFLYDSSAKPKGIFRE